MKLFVGILIVATTALAQLQGSNRGPNLATGPRIVSNPNLNLGLQAEGSHFDSGFNGANLIGGRVVGAFDNRPANQADINNNIASPSESRLAGNVGTSANGLLNNVKGLMLGLPGPIRRDTSLHRRDTVLNNGRNPNGFLLPASVRGHIIYPSHF
ncbi:hypothetical protein EV179_004768 [Coemansia sp. RSA 487]|nr:hypothetical protein LPJ74_004586 [Coemansia sp. RSA 1843]KAJ2212298.1 hypothetical protein EV179_004768 [Coemansia sp. RSA 487]